MCPILKKQIIFSQQNTHFIEVSSTIDAWCEACQFGVLQNLMQLRPRVSRKNELVDVDGCKRVRFRMHVYLYIKHSFFSRCSSVVYWFRTHLPNDKYDRV